MTGFTGVLLTALLPQLILAGVAVVGALIALVRPRERPDLHRWLACIGLLGAIAASGFVLFGVRRRGDGVALSAWNGGLSVDRFSLFVTIVACGIALITCLSSDSYLRRIPSRSGAFCALLLVATLATSALAAQHEMIALFIALQLLLVCLAAIAALLKTDAVGAEAAWKLVLEGVVASALVAYGLTLLYGVTGNDSLASVAAALHRAPAVATLGVALVLLGMTGFIGVFPWGRWPSRVAEALPGAAAGFVVVMGTTGGVVALLRFGVSGLGAAVHPWIGLATALVALALLHAALTAFRALRMSRLVAAVVSSQSALLVLAFLDFGAAGSGLAQAGPTSFLFALVVFALATLATFTALAMLQNAGLGDSLAGFRGLAQRSPATALLLALALGTLVGLPPLAGFIARLFILTSAFSGGYGWLAIVALACGVVTAVPVLRAIASMYAETGDEQPFTLLATPRLGRVVATTCCFTAVCLTVLAEPLLVAARGGAGPIP